MSIFYCRKGTLLAGVVNLLPRAVLPGVRPVRIGDDDAWLEVETCARPHLPRIPRPKLRLPKISLPRLRRKEVDIDRRVKN